MNSPAERSDPAATTLDAFYGGAFHLLQPASCGFRGGLDALLLAASVPRNREGAAADLGAGAGTAGFALAVRSPGLRVTLVENQPAMVDLARRSLELAANAALAQKVSVVEADVLGKREARERAGLFDGSFGTVITNPPFHPVDGRASPDTLRHAARAMPTAGFLAGWIRTASILLEDRGLFALLARPDNLPEILAAVPNRFGDLRILPVFARADRPAIRILVHARRGSKAPLSLLSPIVLHAPDGTLTGIGEAVGAGTATLGLGLH
jgi:tRNA1(Val) A37 N6-methylase TrmN6